MSGPSNPAAVRNWKGNSGTSVAATTIGTPHLGMIDSSAPAEAEAMRGAGPYLETLRLLHQTLVPRFYLEIGVRHGASLSLAAGPAVGIDPAPDVKCALSHQTRVVTDTSDHFFARADDELGNEPIDLSFIDGMHWFEFALRDFMNVERNAHPATVIVFDDVFPVHPWQAERNRRTRVWTGDVWKMIVCLRRVRPELVLLPVDTFPTGLLVVAGLEPHDTRMWKQYESLVTEFTSDKWSNVPVETLDRRAAKAPADPCLFELCQLLRAHRGSGLPTSHFRRTLDEFRTKHQL